MPGNVAPLRLMTRLLLAPSTGPQEAAAPRDRHSPARDPKRVAAGKATQQVSTRTGGTGTPTWADLMGSLATFAGASEVCARQGAVLALSGSKSRP